MYGRKHTAEAKRLIGESAKRRTGYKHSDETKAKIGNTKQGEKHHFYGKNLTEQHKKKIGESQKGKKLTAEHKKKISDAAMGENNSRGFLGKKHTAESNEKRSDGIKKAWAKKRMLAKVMVAIALDYRSKKIC